MIQIHDTVRTPFEVDGFVLGIYDSGFVKKFDVRYFLNGKINHEYFYEDELKLKLRADKNVSKTV